MDKLTWKHIVAVLLLALAGWVGYEKITDSDIDIVVTEEPE